MTKVKVKAPRARRDVEGDDIGAGHVPGGRHGAVEIERRHLGHDIDREGVAADRADEGEGLGRAVADGDQLPGDRVVCRVDIKERRGAADG